MINKRVMLWNQRQGLSPFEQSIIRAAHQAVRRLMLAHPDSSFVIQTNNVNSSERMDLMIYCAGGKRCKKILPSMAWVIGRNLFIGNGKEMGEIDEFFLIELKKQVCLESITEKFS